MEQKTYLTTRNFEKANRSSVDYIVIHYTANNGDTAMGNAKYFHTEYRAASAHYFVDSVEAVQVVQDKDIAWHCGDTQKYIPHGGASYKGKCKNHNSIGVEMCSKIVNGEYIIPEQTQKNAAELVGELLRKYPHATVIRHFDVTGKLCPRPFVDHAEQWKSFLAKIYKEDDDMDIKRFTELMNEYHSNLRDNDCGAWSKDARDWAISTGLFAGGTPLPDGTPNYMWEDTMTREQTAQLFYRFAQMVGKA